MRSQACGGYWFGPIGRIPQRQESHGHFKQLDSIYLYRRHRQRGVRCVLQPQRIPILIEAIVDPVREPAHEEFSEIILVGPQVFLEVPHRRPVVGAVSELRDGTILRFRKNRVWIETHGNPTLGIVLHPYLCKVSDHLPDETCAGPAAPSKNILKLPFESLEPLFYSSVPIGFPRFDPSHGGLGERVGSIAILEVAFPAEQLTDVLFQREEVAATLPNDEFLLIRRETGKPSEEQRPKGLSISLLENSHLRLRTPIELRVGETSEARRTLAVVLTMLFPFPFPVGCNHEKRPLPALRPPEQLLQKFNTALINPLCVVQPHDGGPSLTSAHQPSELFTQLVTGASFRRLFQVAMPRPLALARFACRRNDESGKRSEGPERDACHFLAHKYDGLFHRCCPDFSALPFETVANSAPRSGHALHHLDVAVQHLAGPGQRAALIVPVSVAEVLPPNPEPHELRQRPGSIILREVGVDLQIVATALKRIRPEAVRTRTIPPRIGGELAVEGLNQGALPDTTLGDDDRQAGHSPPANIVEQAVEPSQLLLPAIEVRDCAGGFGGGTVVHVGILQATSKSHGSLLVEYGPTSSRSGWPVSSESPHRACAAISPAGRCKFLPHLTVILTTFDGDSYVGSSQGLFVGLLQGPNWPSGMP